MKKDYPDDFLFFLQLCKKSYLCLCGISTGLSVFNYQSYTMLKKSAIPAIFVLILTVCATGSCTSSKRQSVRADSSDFVTLSADSSEFMLRGEPYRYVGANFWYGVILASPGEGGDRSRLSAELDSLQALGIDNLRILVGGDGNRPIECHIEPTLQKEPGVYDNNLLEGLDHLLAELEKRDMRAVLYLNNTWEWSGGFGTYLEWTGHGDAPLPSRDGYNTFCDYVEQFMADTAAQSLFDNHIRAIVGRTSSITRKPLAQSPAIMSWQIANEPRFFNADPGLFEKWLLHCGRLIKELDPNHLVSTGNEGIFGCSGDIDLWARIHNSDAIDYATIHIWPYNWRWVKADSLEQTLTRAIDNTMEYIDAHRALTRRPLVIEEFGFPRDSMSIAYGSPTTLRDAYYKALFDRVNGGDRAINGVNFWGWGGIPQPSHATWQKGDPYSGDPAQEPQGLNSVFLSDTTTVALIRQANTDMRKTGSFQH